MDHAMKWAGKAQSRAANQNTKDNMRTHTVHKQAPLMRMIQEPSQPTKREILLTSIQMLEKAADIQPRTTRESFDETNEEYGIGESVKYIKWLVRQAPQTAIAIPFDWTE